MGLFRFLKIGLALVLTFVGLKMLAAFFDFEIPVTISLSVIVSILLLSILASLIIKKGDSTSVM